MPNKKSLEEWTKEAERIEVSKNLLYFKQGVGLRFDKKKLGLLEKKARDHAKRFLSQFGREPRELFLMSVSSIGSERTYRYYLKLHDARVKKVVSSKFKFQGSPVNWGSWRQFAALCDDSRARKELFDDFLSKVPILTPLIRSRFDGYSSELSKHGLDPLTEYLEVERIDYDALLSFVDKLGSGLRAPFRDSLRSYSDEILGRDAEYYDDYYFFRSRVFERYQKKLPIKVHPVKKIIATMKEMGLPGARRVAVDDADRKGKDASAFCSTIKVGEDVRISYRRSSGLENFSSVFHEFGHGVHGVSIDPALPYWDKYLIANGVAEIFSIFFEGLMHNGTYLREELQVSDDVAKDLLARYRFNELFFVTFYSANSIMKLKYWHDHLTMEEANALYSDLTERYMGIRYPGEYWQLHHVMPSYTLYSPSYLIAAVRAMELASVLESKFGTRYWKERDAGEFVYSLLRAGRALDLPKFSKLDADAYVRRVAAAG